ncbi:hypothetical protein CIW49_22725 [Mycolicibacterium sp. P1-18]|uniref:hypothetical protein n=1 Tax=Mycolicibacterium sp. P1-18 TaxID=2024615 RepID=UPI0011F30D07|nr:hypothetical protein [Mycolicibacterium sp. P1-18]KAA0095295.1 hypothetical protein CIW49_22725 [Mycolicibacterium sp. P1-18]
MSSRRWFLAGAFAFAAAIAVVVVVVIPDEAQSDCDTVRQMLDFNQAHNVAVAQVGSDKDPTETPMADYQEWASQLRTYANQVQDGSLAKHAEELAALASQTVTVVGQARDDGSRSPVSDPPPWVREYAQLNAQFKQEVSALSAACPR